MRLAMRVGLFSCSWLSPLWGAAMAERTWCRQRSSRRRKNNLNRAWSKTAPGPTDNGHLRSGR